MQKNTWLALVFFIVSFSWAQQHVASSVNFGAITVTTTIDGFSSVSNSIYSSPNSWDLEYGPVGFAPGTGTLINYIGMPSIGVVINQFEKYDFRFRNRDYLGQVQPWGDWSTMYTYNTCTDNSNALGYTFDFNTSMEAACWKGYEMPLVTYNSSTNDLYINTSQNHNGTGTSIALLDYSYLDGKKSVLVAPKLSNMANDKKIKFWIKNYNKGGLQVGTLGNPHDVGTFHLLGLLEAQTDANGWEEKTVYFDNYNGTDQYIAFVFDKYYQNYDEIYIDDFSYEQSMNCSDISNLAVSAIHENDVTFNFNAAAGQNIWEISYKNLTSGVTKTLNANSNPYTLNTLTGNTNYEVKIRAACEPGHFSNWSAIIPFTTICSTMSEGYTSSFTEENYVDPCWSVITSGADIAQSSGPSFNALIYLPRTGSKMIKMENNSTSATQKSYLITPYIQDLDANKRIRFFLKSSAFSDYNINPLVIGTMSDPADAATFVPIETISPLDMNEINGYHVSSDWKEHIVYFDHLAAGQHYIAFRQAGTQASSTFYIDDFAYENKPACPQPENLKTLGTTENSAKVSWENYELSAASSWQIEFGPTGFVHGTGILVTASATPFNIQDGLSADTDYDYYVRSNCGTYSSWSDKEHFKTKCSGVQPNYTTSFEAEEFDVNSCWTRITPQLRNDFYTASVFVRTAVSGHTGGKSVSVLNEQNAVNYEPQYNSKTILVTPRLNDFNNYKRISFWIKAEYGVKIIVGTLQNPEDYSTFVPFRNITTTGTGSTWVKYEVDFAGFTGTAQFVGIKHDAGTARNIFYLDDFTYIGDVCPRPTQLTAAQSGTGSILLTWQNNDQLNGAATWELEYGPIGFVTGTGTTINVLQNLHDLSGLTASSSYEYHVRTICSPGVLSNWSDKYAFKIMCTLTAPFTETFDTLTAGSTGPCWHNPVPMLAQSGARYNFEGIHSLPNCVTMATSTFETLPTAMLISPYLPDFDNTKRLKLWADNWTISLPYTAQDNTTIVIGTMSNPLDMTTFVPYTTLNMTGIGMTGKEYIVDFSSYTGNAKHFALLYHGEGSEGSVTFDDIAYSAINNCIEPANPQIKNVSNTAATVSWDANENAVVAIEYGTPGFVDGTGIMATVTTSSFEMTSLLPQTRYEVHLKTKCGETYSYDAGPLMFTTSCDPQSLPWLETFAGMQSYGMNILPPCFKSIGDSEWNSRNAPWINCCGTYSGSDDANFLSLEGIFYASLITPSFHLDMGTTYTFKLMAKKSSEYADPSVNLYTGLGNAFEDMTNNLDGFNTFVERLDYNQFQYYFTPLVSGDYSFLVHYRHSGGMNVQLDAFELVEGYRSVVQTGTGNTTFSFQSEPGDAVIFETTTNCKIAIADDAAPNVLNNKSVKMTGSNTPEEWTDANNLWEANQNNITKINLKVAPPQTPNFFMSFDMRQTSSALMKTALDNGNSMFRVIVDGNIIGDVLLPATTNNDGMVKYEFDLTPYRNGNLRISLQHLGKTAADNAFIDNLTFSPESLLEVYENTASGLKYYPNPVTGQLTISDIADISNVEVFGYSGQLLFKSDYSAREIKLDLHSLASGVYFVKVASGQGTKTLKVLKK